MGQSLLGGVCWLSLLFGVDVDLRADLLLPTDCLVLAFTPDDERLDE